MIREINLAGTYGFTFDKEKCGVREAYYNKNFDDTISLPGTTAQAKKGMLNTARETGFLTELYPYEGWAWFSKEIELDEEACASSVHLILERTRMTRVWVDETEVFPKDGAEGMYDSLTTPHVYDLTTAIDKPSFRLTILVSNSDYPTKGGHLTSPDTQTNWIGITGRMALEILSPVHIERVGVKGKLSPMEAELSAEIVNLTGTECERKIRVVAREYENGDSAMPPFETTVKLPPGKSTHRLTYPLPQAKAWSEYTPVLYTLTASLYQEERETDTYETCFGLREIATEGLDIKLNGHKIFLRGVHDAELFPRTGAAPTELSDWLAVMKTFREYGMNHVRFHTCCPPEAAFFAADLTGICLCPELPFWGTLAAPGEEGFNEAEQAFLIAEGLRMQECYGNHPSFTMLSLGNELWGSAERMGEIIRILRAADDRHLFTQGSNNFQHMPKILPEDDYFCGVRFSRDRLIRGSYGMCDAPLGHVQTEEPGTRHSYDPVILPETAVSADGSEEAGESYIEIQYGTGVKRVKASAQEGTLIPDKPVITHEIGQYETFPNFDEIEKYTGVLAARNYEVFRERLEKKGLLPLAKRYFESSGALAVQCYKEELEAAHRSSLVSGYQILDLKDFSGQGTALVGILDAFMDNKGLIGAEAWRGFCSDLVLLAEFDKYVWEAGERFSADIRMSFYDYAHEMSNDVVKAEIKDQNGEILFEEDLAIPDGAYGLVSLKTVEMKLPEVGEPAVLMLTLSCRDRQNSYRLSVYSHHEELKNITPEMIKERYGVTLTKELSEAEDALRRGEKVLYLQETPEESIPGTYATDFWCYPMFRDICESMGKPVAIGTMGLLIGKDHPLLSGLCSESYTTPDWYHIIEHTNLAVLDDVTEKDNYPIVQMIDNFERNHKLGLLYELATPAGEVYTLCSRVLEITDHVEVRSFLHGLLCNL